MADVKPTVDPYRVLGVARGADLDQIKAAHRRLAKRFHPDGSTGDEKRFLAVQEAYQLLADPLRRREWDRRHAPGPVRAPGARGARATAGGPRQSSGDATVRRSARAPGARAERPPAGHTWSAERVPWWEDFTPRGGNGAQGRGSAPAGTSEARQPGDATSDPGRDVAFDFDVFDRSSGAAWSMAARRHFRRGEADLPSRGAWRYRGTQVVTGAEARKVAAEEAAAEAAARAAEQQRLANEEALFRRRTRMSAAERQAFDHEPTSQGSRSRDPRPQRRAEPAGAARPARGAQPARGAEPTGFAQPARGAQPAGAAQPGGGAEPVQGAERARGAEPTRGRDPLQPEQVASPRSLGATLSDYLRSRLGHAREGDRRDREA